MSKKNDGAIRAALARAERQGRCLVATDPAVAAALRRRRWLVSPARGMFFLKDAWEGMVPPQRELMRIRTLAHEHPNWVFCSISAAVSYGFEVSHHLLGTIHIEAETGARNGPGALVRRHPCHGEAVFEREGIKVVDVLETLFGCMRDAPFPDAVAIVDSALRKGVRRDELHDYLEGRCSGRKGVVRARAILAFADGRAESGGESIARVMIAKLGFAAPELQVEIPDPVSAGRRYRFDYLWRLSDGALIAGELDGLGKYRGQGSAAADVALSVLAAERRRESRLTLYRIPILRFSFSEVLDETRFRELLDAFGVPRDERQRKRVAC